MDDNIWDAAALVLFVTFVFLLLKDIWKYLIWAIIILLILFFICLYFIMKRKKKAFKEEKEEKAEVVNAKVVTEKKEEKHEESFSKEELKKEIKEEVKKEMENTYYLSSNADFNSIRSSSISSKSLIEQFAYYVQTMVTMQESSKKLANRFKNEKIRDKYYNPIKDFQKDIDSYLALPLDSVDDYLVETVKTDANNLKELYLDLYEAYKNNSLVDEEVFVTLDEDDNKNFVKEIETTETEDVKEEKEEKLVPKKEKETSKTKEENKDKEEKKIDTKTTKKKTVKKDKESKNDDVINPYNYKKENDKEEDTITDSN